MHKPLIEYSDAELRIGIRQSSEHVIYHYNDLVAELDRRTLRRQGTIGIWTAIVSAAVATIAVAIAALSLVIR